MSSTDASTRRAILAAQLHRLADQYAVTDAPYAQQLELLACQAASDPSATLSPVLDRIIDLAENPRANFSEYTAIQIDNAALRVKARRDAVAKSDFHLMLRLNNVYWTLHNEVARRTGGIVAQSIDSSTFNPRDDYNIKRRRQRGGRW